MWWAAQVAQHGGQQQLQQPDAQQHCSSSLVAQQEGEDVQQGDRNSVREQDTRTPVQANFALSTQHIHRHEATAHTVMQVIFVLQVLVSIAR